MAQITVSREISMGHRLPAYDGICSSMHGHNVRFEVKVNAAGFLDFKLVDRHLETLLAELDHAMVLAHDDPWVMTMPKGQRLVTLSVDPTTENLAQLILNEMSLIFETQNLPARIHSVHAFETSKYSAVAFAPDGNRTRRI